MTGDAAPARPGTPRVRTGGCLCGGVRFRLSGPLRPGLACHCETCRRISGHHVAATSSALADVAFDGDATLRWFRSSPDARRGFCGTCGAALFWQADGGDRLSISLGSLDAPTGLRLAAHMFAASRSDYYDLDPALPAFDAFPPDAFEASLREAEA